MDDPTLRGLLKILRFQSEMIRELAVSVEALKSLMRMNPAAERMLERFEADAKKESSEPYARALELIDGIEAKLKGSVQ